MYLLYFGDIPNLVSCAFSTIPIFPPFNSQNFLFTCLGSFFTCFAEEAGALLRPKNGYLVWSTGHVGYRVSSARAHVWRAQAQNIAAAYFLSCTELESAERVARRQLAFEFSVPSSHGSND